MDPGYHVLVTGAEVSGTARCLRDGLLIALVR